MQRTSTAGFEYSVLAVRQIFVASVSGRFESPDTGSFQKMCIGLVALNASPKFQVVIALNRDEFFSRPTAAATFWEGTDILAGRDELAGGTWFGVTRSGRIGLVTNIRVGSPDLTNAKSRGHLVRRFLEQDLSAMECAGNIQSAARQYGPFNLLLWDTQQMSYVSSRCPPRVVPDGVFGLSNGDLDEQWPKVRQGTSRLKELMAAELDSTQLVPRLFETLGDRIRPQDEELPDTGVGVEVERELSATFVDIPSQDYGTRTSTVLLIDHHMHVVFVERTYARNAQTWRDAEFEFAISPE